MTMPSAGDFGVILSQVVFELPVSPRFDLDLLGLDSWFLPVNGLTSTFMFISYVSHSL